MNSGPDTVTDTPAGTLNYTYTAPPAVDGAVNPDAVCPPTQAQVNMGLTNCAMAVADGNGNEYGFGYVTYPGQTNWTQATPANAITLPGFGTGYKIAPGMSITPSTVTPGGSVTVAGAQFFADPDGTLTEPLTAIFLDSAGTINESTFGQGTLTSPAPSSGSKVACTGCAIPPVDYLPGNHAGSQAGTLSGGVLNATSVPVPSGGLANYGTGGATAFVAGTLTVLVLEPSVAPFNDGIYDTVAATTTTTCTGTPPINGTPCYANPGAPNANPAPLGAIGANGVLLQVLTVTTTSLPAATIGTPYSDTLTSTYGTGPYTWSVTAGTLPAGLTLHAGTGVIDGTPTALAVTESGLKFTVVDSEPASATSAAMSLTVNQAFAITAPPAGALAGGTPGVPYGPVTLTGQGGILPYSWSVTTGSLPAGLTLHALTGVIDGTPTTQDNSAFTVTLTDSTPQTTTRAFSIAITNAAPGAPTNLGAVAGNGAIALTWTAPANNGGSAITSYTVTCTPTTGPVVTGTVTGTPPATTTTLTTLGNGVVNSMTYSCSVTATNAVGTSGPSNTVTAQANSTQCTVSGYSRPSTGPAGPAGNVGTPGGNCLTTEVISAPVTGSDLSINDAAQSVKLSGVTLGGEFQNATGNLNTVIVNDSRGTLTGWTVTGQMESAFINEYGTGNSLDNVIPADFLTWAPWVSLATPGEIPANNTNTPWCPNDATSTTCQGPSGLPAAAGTPTVVVGGTLPAGINGTGAGTTTSSTPAEVWYGPTTVLNDYQGTTYGGQAGQAKVLCEAPTGGGGGEFACGAWLSLAVPPYVAGGTYVATMDIVVTGL
jgi:hypothetical protein